MWLLLVEAVFAMLILVFIVWWTMFCGRGSKVENSRLNESFDKQKKAKISSEVKAIDPNLPD
jgi:hypothetical protein